MKYFFFGDFELKINQKISEIVTKNNFSRKYFDVEDENISEILAELSSENLFGDKNIYLVDITDTDIHSIQEFLKKIPSVCDLVVIYRDSLEKSSKILKSLPNDFTQLEFKKTKAGNVFNFVDSLVSKDISKTYSELSKLEENEVLIFNNIVSAARSLISIKKDLNIKNKIIPFKVGFYKKNAEKYTVEELDEIYNNLHTNDLRFKKGEINAEMLLVHSVNLFFLNKNGSIK